MVVSEIRPEKMVEINIHDRMIRNFSVLDVFVKIAGHIARGGSLDVIGKNITEIKELTGIRPVVSNMESQITGSVIYIDNYGNVISNITRKLFEEVGRGRSFSILARTAKFAKVYDQYSDAINFNFPADKREEDGKKLALWNSSNYLELAIYKSSSKTVGGAASLFGLDYRDRVQVTFM